MTHSMTIRIRALSVRNCGDGLFDVTIPAMLEEALNDLHSAIDRTDCLSRQARYALHDALNDEVQRDALCSAVCKKWGWDE